MTKVEGVVEKKGYENNLEIVNLAKFALDELNNVTKNDEDMAVLTFKKVVKVKEQVMETGTMYYITMETETETPIATNEDDNKYYYEAKIWVKPWLDFKQLEYMKIIWDFIEDVKI